jgi:uncharacterized protein YdhG (YjbR/CyaY superfamily)
MRTTTTRGGPQTIDEYVAGFPPEVQRILQEIRRTIAGVIPEATEAIKYQIPTFVLEKNVIHFAAHKKHIGVYPVPKGDSGFEEAIAPYQTGKGTAQFPLDRPIPYDLIRRMVEFRLMSPDIGGAWQGRRSRKN